jgi:DNA-binding transcriptional regulator of glucitol operon
MDEVEGDCIIKSFVICTLHQILFGRMRWEEHAASIGEMRNEYKIFVGKPKGKRPLGTPTRR